MLLIIYMVLLVPLILLIGVYSIIDIKYAEYRRKPDITVNSAIEIRNEIKDGKIVVVPYMKTINVDIEEENNLMCVCIINPNDEVENILGHDYKKEIEEYFYKEFFNGKSDIDINGYRYFYRFIVFSGIDGIFEVNLFYFKINKYLKHENMLIKFNKVDYTNLFELEYSDECAYEGERIMAEQFREISEDFNGSNGYVAISMN